MDCTMERFLVTGTYVNRYVSILYGLELLHPTGGGLQKGQMRSFNYILVW